MNKQTKQTIKLAGEIFVLQTLLSHCWFDVQLFRLQNLHVQNRNNKASVGPLAKKWGIVPCVPSAGPDTVVNQQRFMQR